MDTLVESKSYKLYLGDCLEILPMLEAGSADDTLRVMPQQSNHETMVGAKTKIDCVVTDPPYGCGKADWDDLFPVEWYSLCRSLASRIVIITGSSGLQDSVPLVGADFVDVISARNLNGMTRSPLGFGNWLAAVVAGEKPAQSMTFFEFVVNGKKVEHPSPKPLDYMLKLIERVTNLGDIVLDPFMGSGTTGMACMKLGRNFIGIEKEPKYFEIAKRRIEQAAAQLLLPLQENESTTDKII